MVQWTYSIPLDTNPSELYWKGL